MHGYIKVVGYHTNLSLLAERRLPKDLHTIQQVMWIKTIITTFGMSPNFKIQHSKLHFQMRSFVECLFMNSCYYIKRTLDYPTGKFKMFVLGEVSGLKVPIHNTAIHYFISIVDHILRSLRASLIVKISFFHIDFLFQICQQ